MSIIIIKQQCSSSSSMMQHQYKSASWSDLGLDLLIEIIKKLCNYGDHIRFRGVCKSWRAVGPVERAAYYVLPWMMTLRDIISNRLCYKLYEPPPPSQVEYKSSIKSNTSAAVTSGTINLGDYFNHTLLQPNIVIDYRYVDGWLHISVYNCKSEISSFLFFSLATKSSFTLPQLNHSAFPMYLALSATPDSADCVFLALNVINDYTRTISIFRHGDTHWTTTQSVGGWFGKPRDNKPVVIHGVSYFLTSRRIGSYDLATEVLKVDHYSTVLVCLEIYNFFGLDGDLMLAYFEIENWKLCLRKYDWSNKAWVPLQSLGDRSLYLSRFSVYVDQINYYGISSSANKTYVRVINRACSVDEYTLEDGQLTKCPSTITSLGDPCSYTPFAIWVCPPDVLRK